jgi:hypothetical protein
LKRDYDVKVRVKELKLGDLVYCLFLCYLYTFTMIPFFALLAPDHELPSIWLPTNTIKLISIPPLIFDAPLLLN